MAGVCRELQMPAVGAVGAPPGADTRKWLPLAAAAAYVQQHAVLFAESALLALAQYKLIEARVSAERLVCWRFVPVGETAMRHRTSTNYHRGGTRMRACPSPHRQRKYRGCVQSAQWRYVGTTWTQKGLLNSAGSYA